MKELSATYTICVVDDDQAVRVALTRLLRADGWCVASFESAEAFLADWNRAQPTCLVLDVDLPGLDGLALQQRLAEADLALPIVFLTGRGDIPMSVRAIKAGAADFLTKPVRGESLNAALQAAIEAHAARRLDQAEMQLVHDRLASLSAREQQVLAGIVAGKLNKQIAFDLGIVEQTVKYHRARIMKAMQARTAAELMHLVARIQQAD